MRTKKQRRQRLAARMRERQRLRGYRKVYHIEVEVILPVRYTRIQGTIA